LSLAGVMLFVPLAAGLITGSLAESNHRAR
jgi:hypothetical protein